MKLTAEIAGGHHELNIKRDGARLSAEIDGRRYEIEAREIGSGIYLLIDDGRVYECRVDRGRAGFNVNVGDHLYAVTIADPKRLRGAQAQGAHDGEGAAQVVAPMPGKVVRVLVREGAQVEAGEGLVIVEAMKMQNEMKSPRAGTVVAVHAEAGATVNAGDVLVVVE
ncbi:MAG: biotin/lipoyl-containing protein [Pyrinomonadaceae bacterium]